MTERLSIAGLRSEARAAFLAGVEAADPGPALARALTETPPVTSGRLLILGIGKAAPKLVETALQFAPEATPVEALAVTNYENETSIAGARVMTAAHPVPDESGLAAARAVLEMADGAGSDDLMLCLVSGGASALLPAPVSGLSLADKVAVNRLLLASGLDITEMNLVRQSLSELKGGGLLRHAAPATVRSYILSDVLGDDPRVIASGPSVGPVGTRAEACALLRSRGIWPDLPVAVQEVLAGPDLPDPPASDAVLIGSNGMSLRAMAGAAGAAISVPALEGDVAAAAARVVREAKAAGPGARIAFGGETTVTLRGKGRGGRNQELALHVAIKAAEAGIGGDWVFLSGGTDGRDGPTSAAGGLVDAHSLSRIAAAGIDLDARLADNDSFAVLDAADDLLMTGATGTNVADLQLFLRGPA